VNRSVHYEEDQATTIFKAARQAEVFDFGQVANSERGGGGQGPNVGQPFIVRRDFVAPGDNQSQGKSKNSWVRIPAVFVG